MTAMTSWRRAVLTLSLAFAACESTAPAPAPQAKTQAAPAPKTPPPPDADVVAGKKVGPLTLGAKPPAGHDGSRVQADGAQGLYWSELGVHAIVGKGGLVVAAAAASPASDPFFRKAFAGKTAQGLAIGATAADAKAQLGPCKEKASPSPFVSARVVLTCKDAGLSLDLSKSGGEVIAMWVGPPRS
jgi:hypothetical protein